ncbi:hypothetical protein A8W25_09250 [Streptomyces sp. ERV7]|uniref:hypothetical protein n=1 Tax=Streptomyces sp. ERV7 TaxID=1322334 RepID=UPI0007F4F614|nr:hypothetical protein [Streptomyces sp. ERV7]OAR25730.1 hypothetical protein A8W25_09250 [Streptomyces sp. ERV7]
MTRGTEQRPVWTHKDDERWAAEFELTLAYHHNPPTGLADEILAEVHEIATEAGRPIREVVGEPDAYAGTVAAERISETRRSAADLDGFAPGGRFTTGLVMAGFQAVLFGIVLWVSDGFWLTAGWPELTGGALLAALSVTVSGVLPELRAAAHLRAWRVTLAAVCALVLTTAALFTAVPSGSLVEVPAPALFGVGALLAVAGFRLSDERAARWFLGRRAAAEPVGDDAWLARLEKLLRGRHGYPAAAAARCREEARDHLRASGGGAAEEFGPVEVYALRLADNPGRASRSARIQLVPAAAMCALSFWWGYDLLAHPEPGSVWFWVKAVVLPPAIWAWVSTLLDIRSTLRRAARKDTAERDRSE